MLYHRLNIKLKQRSNRKDLVSDCSACTYYCLIVHILLTNDLSDFFLGHDGDKATDLRLLANAAKPLLELETLITHPHLQGIEFVSKSVPYVRDFGVDLRHQAQDTLLGALKEKNQAVIATSLQVRKCCPIHRCIFRRLSCF